MNISPEQEQLLEELGRDGQVELPGIGTLFCDAETREIELVPEKDFLEVPASLAFLGTFQKVRRPQRLGINPHTGAEITVRESDAFVLQPSPEMAAFFGM
jgi:hypothetical protein